MSGVYWADGGAGACRDNQANKSGKVLFNKCRFHARCDPQLTFIMRYTHLPIQSHSAESLCQAVLGVLQEMGIVINDCRSHCQIFSCTFTHGAGGHIRNSLGAHDYLNPALAGNWSALMLSFVEVEEKMRSHYPKSLKCSCVLLFNYVYFHHTCILTTSYGTGALDCRDDRALLS